MALWVTLGLNHERRTLVIVGFADSKRAAQAEGIKRVDTFPYESHNAFLFSENMANDVAIWLREEIVGIKEETVAAMVVHIGQALYQILSNENEKT